MTDPNLIEAISKLTHQIDHSAWWICLWLFYLILSILFSVSTSGIIDAIKGLKE